MHPPRPIILQSIAPAPTTTTTPTTTAARLTRTIAILLALLVLDNQRVNCLMSNSVEDWVSGSAVVCNGIPGLTKEQKELCQRSPDVTVAAIKGIQMAIAECQHQFQWHRWNCSSLTPSSLTQHSSVILQRGYRETGFVYAISSAGVAHSVSRACSMGKLISCGCDPSSYTTRTTRTTTTTTTTTAAQAASGKSSSSSSQLASRDGAGSATQWKWGGCSHNLDFGVEFSKQFLDGREVAGDIQSTVNLHNNQAGRNAVGSNMQIRCKCHGMSGSCELKTCWKVVPDFRMVGRTLKNRFRNAVAVTQSNFGNVSPLSRVRGGGSRRRANGRQERRRKAQRNRGNGSPGSNAAGAGQAADAAAAAAAAAAGDAGAARKSHRGGNRSGHGNRRKARKAKNLASQLFFFQKSPNFCERDAHADIAGTSGRRCNRPSAGGDGCASLCCGRGYNVVRQRRFERCGCKFHWCCFVQCQNCTVEEWITVCK